MLPTGVRYASLEETLQRLGFIKRIDATAHVRFEHADGAVFATRAYTPNEVVREIVLVAARSTADDWGIADRETFERLLAESIAQNSSSAPAHEGVSTAA